MARDYYIKGKVEEKDFFTESMSSNYWGLAVTSVQFYSDEYITQVTPSSGTISIQVTTDETNYTDIHAGEFAASSAYSSNRTIPTYSLPANKLKLTLSGVSGAVYFKVTIARNASSGGFGSGGSGSSVSTVSAIAEDMFFTSNQGRDTWTSGHTDRLFNGIACAVGSNSQYNYFMWNAQEGQWFDANLIYQGEKGEKGEKGESGDTANSVDSQTLELNGKTINQTTKLSDGTEIDSSVTLNYLTDGEIQSKINAETVTSISQNVSGQNLTTTISNAGGTVSTSTVSLPEAGGDGVTIDQVETIAKEKADAAETNANAYTNEEIAKIPSGGGSTVDLPDNTVPMVISNKLVDSGLIAIDGSIKTAPNSVEIGYQRYSSGGISSFIYDKVSNKYYRVLRQNAKDQTLMCVKTSQDIKEHQTTNSFESEVSFTGSSFKNIELPTETEKYIYIPASNIEFGGFFEIALARAVTSELTIELDIIGDVILKKNLGILDSGLIQIDNPPMDLDLASDVGLKVYQKNGEPVFLGGHDGKVYLRFKYQPFNLTSIQSETGGDVTLQEVETIAEQAKQEAITDATTKYLSLDGGVLNGRLSIYASVNPEIIIGQTSLNRFKLKTSDDLFTLEHHRDNADNNLFEAGVNGVDFKVKPKLLGDELATVTFVKEEIAKGGGGDGAVNTVVVTYEEDSKKLFVQVNDKSDFQQLDFIDIATLITTQEDTLQQAKNYTDDEIAKLPSGGGDGGGDAKVGEIIMLADRSVADNTMIYCDHAVVKKADYPELYVAIGDKYSQVNTPDDSFGVPLIEDTVSQTSQVRINLNDEIARYENAYDPANLQLSGAFIVDEPWFLFNKVDGDLKDTSLIKIDKDSGAVVGVNLDFTTNFTANCIASTDRYISVIGLKGNELWHTVVFQQQIIVNMAKQLDTDFVNPKYCMFVRTNRSLVVLDEVSTGRFTLKSMELNIEIVDNKPSGVISFGEGDTLDVGLMDPKNLVIVESDRAQGTGSYIGIGIVTNEGNTEFYSMSKSFLLLTKSNTLEDIQLTGVDQDLYVTQGGNKRYFATDNESLFLISMGLGISDAENVIVDFYKKIHDGSATENLCQPFIHLGNETFTKGLVTHDNGVILFSKSKEEIVSVDTEKTSHYIKAKTNHSSSGTVEKVELTVNNQDLTVDVNDITSTVTLPLPDVSALDARMDNMDVLIGSLQSKVTFQEGVITGLLDTIEDLKKAAYSGFALYSNNDKELQVCMKHIDTSINDDKQTIVINGTSPSPDDPDGGGLYNVYHGWTKNDINELLDDEITNTLPEERTLTQHIYGDSYTPPAQSDYQYLLDATFAHTRTTSGDLEADASYIYIAFPAQIVSPEVSRVTYGGMVAKWRGKDILINGVPYKILMTDTVVSVSTYSVKLSNGGQ